MKNRVRRLGEVKTKIQIQTEAEGGRKCQTTTNIGNKKRMNQCKNKCGDPHSVIGKHRFFSS